MLVEAYEQHGLLSDQLFWGEQSSSQFLDASQLTQSFDSLHHFAG
jgi:hypothetical protein